MAGFVDLHCHVLPGVDDGARTLDEAVSIARGLRTLGFERVIATPHDRPPRWEQEPARLAELRDRLSDALGDSGPRVGLGAENFLDDMAWRRFESGRLIRYPGGRAALFEFAVGGDALPTGFAERLFQLRVRGIRPVLAHPERYGQIARDGETLARLVAGGAVLLVSLPSLGAGVFDPTRRAATAMVRDGHAAAAATDVHSVRDLALVERGIRRLEKLVGGEGLERMLGAVPGGLVAEGADDER